MACFSLLLFALAQSSCTSLDPSQKIRVHTRVAPANAIPAPATAAPGRVIRVATLNIAHGRKDSFNQLFLRESRIRRNLDDIARAIRQHKPDIMALQEADAPSLWSTGFDQVAYLAAQAGYPWYVHAINLNSWYAAFGTALLSRLPLLESMEYTFDPSPPTLPKGFALASIRWPAGHAAPAQTVDIISVHLDFSRESVRESQLRELGKVLSRRNNPTIILGDFNSDWFQERSAVRALATKSRFSTFQPGSDAYNSYKDKRLDWILVTRDMEFISYRVLPDILSDHRMIVAEIKFK